MSPMVRGIGTVDRGVLVLYGVIGDNVIWRELDAAALGRIGC